MSGNDVVSVNGDLVARVSDQSGEVNVSLHSTPGLQLVDEAIFGDDLNVADARMLDGQVLEIRVLGRTSATTGKILLPLETSISSFDVARWEPDGDPELGVRGAFLTSATRVTVGGVEASFRVDGDQLQVSSPAGIGVGQHAVVVESALGVSAPATIDVADASYPRIEIELRLRDAPVSMSIGVTCPSVPPIGADTGTFSVDTPLANGGAARIVVPTGVDCTVDAGDAAIGFFDPATDPTGADAFDAFVAPTTVRFRRGDGLMVTSTSGSDFGDSIVWVHARSFGAPGIGGGVLDLSCPSPLDGATLRYGEWARFRSSGDQPCELTLAPARGVVDAFAGRWNPGGEQFDEVVRSTRFGTMLEHDAEIIVFEHWFPDPRRDAHAFVAQSYRDFLGREGDAAGADHWTRQIESGQLTRSDFVSSFLESSEFGGRVGGISRLYQAYFGRLPDSDGLSFWVRKAAAGWTLQNISDFFATSGEFRNRYGELDDADFVDLVYQSVLDRPADGAGSTFWQGRLSSGTSRGRVMLQFSESLEYRAQTEATVRVSSLYFALLQRSPDSSGFGYWVDRAAAGRPLDDLVNGLIWSDEYARRFGLANVGSFRSVDGLPSTTEAPSRPELFDDVDVELRRQGE